MEYSSTGSVLRRYVHGPGVDEPLVWYEGAGTTTRKWLHADERGSIVAVTNASGTVVETHTYGPYGEPSSMTGSRFQYTGQIAIPEAGLYYYKARIYSPSIGRFLQTDPLGYVDGSNLYAYVGGDPINATDPSGLCGSRIPNAMSAQCFGAGTLGFRSGGSGGSGSGNQSPCMVGDCITVTGNRSPAFDFNSFLRSPIFNPFGGYDEFDGYLLADGRVEDAIIGPDLVFGLAGIARGVGRGLLRLGIGATIKGASVLAPEIASTFAGGIYRRVVLKSDAIAFRFSGGRGNPVGQYLTSRSSLANIQTPQDAIGTLALGISRNPETTLNTVLIPRGTEVFVGRVAGSTTGATQIFVRDPSVLKLISSQGF